MANGQNKGAILYVEGDLSLQGNIEKKMILVVTQGGIFLNKKHFDPFRINNDIKY
jgi:hypothetical protein